MFQRYLAAMLNIIAGTAGLTAMGSTMMQNK
ncbi:hypothetical protein BDB13_2187 [Rhodococcus sp. OK302]|nr:hypothetical protein BDB13_2187 [Rhodococcus sp. OK302]